MKKRMQPEKSKLFWERINNLLYISDGSWEREGGGGDISGDVGGAGERHQTEASASQISLCFCFCFCFGFFCFCFFCFFCFCSFLGREKGGKSLDRVFLFLNNSLLLFFGREKKGRAPQILDNLLHTISTLNYTYLLLLFIMWEQGTKSLLKLST